MFGHNSKIHAEKLKGLIAKKVKDGPLAAYGASARSSTLLNFCKINNSEIEFIIDKNKIKHGLYTPGTSIPIISFEEGIKRLESKKLLLLAWNFKDEIISDLRSNSFKNVVIVPFPNILTYL